MVKVKMIDVGEKNEGLTKIESPKKNEKYYPTLYLSTKQLTALKGKKPGDKLTLLVDAEVKGFSLRSTKGKEEEGNYDIEVQKIGISKRTVQEDDDDDKGKKENERLKELTKERLAGGQEKN